jgi:hypothetical protein
MANPPASNASARASWVAAEPPLGWSWFDFPENDHDDATRVAAEAAEECTVWQPPAPAASTEPSPKRWNTTFFVIGLLLVAFGLITFWGLTQSDWLYGTYGQINQAQWDQMVDLRDRLAQLGIAPDAVAALDDALLVPRPSTEDVLFDLRKAAVALEPFATENTVREIQVEINALIAKIEFGGRPVRTYWSTPTPAPTPTLVPIMDAPVALNVGGLSNLLFSHSP